VTDLRLVQDCVAFASRTPSLDQAPLLWVLPRIPAPCLSSGKNVIPSRTSASRTADGLSTGARTKAGPDQRDPEAPARCLGDPRSFPARVGRRHRGSPHGHWRGCAPSGLLRLDQRPFRTGPWRQPRSSSPEMCNDFNGGLLSPVRRVVRDRSERGPRSIGICTLASDADAIGTFMATANLTATPLMVRMVGSSRRESASIDADSHPSSKNGRSFTPRALPQGHNCRVTVA
jgi:hypothetical protein